MNSINTALKNYNKKKAIYTISNPHSRSTCMDKIRSGQSFLYREGGMQSMVVDVRMKDTICADSLKQALDKALLRYPYLTYKMVEKRGDFYLVQNPLPFILEETTELHSLGSEEINYHLIDITYKEKTIYISFHHGLCDGRGIMPFVKTLIYYYCTYKYNDKFNAQDIRLAGENLLPKETEEPYGNGRIEVNETNLPKVYKDGYALPDSINSVNNNKYYRYEIKINHKNFMKFTKENNATPAIVIALLVSQAIKNIYPNAEKPIICNVASDLRNGINMDNTFKNCVGSVSLPYIDKFEKLSFKEQVSVYRKMIEEHKNTDNIKRELNKQIHLSDKLDELPSYEEKKKMLSFFNKLITNTFILSYVGQIKLGDCEKYIDSFHMYSSGTTGCSLQMLSVGKYITINFMQSFKTDKYIKAFAKTLEESGLDFSISDIIEFTTPKDSVSLTLGI